jgi:hypothetical protein
MLKGCFSLSLYSSAVILFSSLMRNFLIAYSILAKDQKYFN